MNNLMAIDMNLMNENFQVTDGVYASLSNMNVKNGIAVLCKNGGIDEVIPLLERSLEEMRDGN